MGKSKVNKARAGGMRRYWRRVKAIRKATGQTTREARKTYKAIRVADLPLGVKSIGASAGQVVEKRVKRRRKRVIFDGQKFAYFGLVEEHPGEIADKVAAALAAFGGGSFAASVKLEDIKGEILAESFITFRVESDDIAEYVSASTGAGWDWIEKVTGKRLSPPGFFWVLGLSVGP